MKILTIICEFNPLHNGHKYLIGRAAASGYDAVVCVMSGCFTQRGEMCRNDKYARARHAVLCGADAVIELPAPFAVAPAEIFAQGAVKTVCSIPGAEAVTFGHETGCAENFFEAARLLNDESEKFRAALESGLDGGESYIRSYCAAFEKCGGDGDFISHPNNILGVEYAKAILKSGKDIKILPVKRIGAGYGEEKLCGNYSSARAIRANAHAPLLLPRFYGGEGQRGKIRAARRGLGVFVRKRQFETGLRVHGRAGKQDKKIARRGLRRDNRSVFGQEVFKIAHCAHTRRKSPRAVRRRHGEIFESRTAFARARSKKRAGGRTSFRPRARKLRKPRVGRRGEKVLFAYFPRVFAMETSQLPARMRQSERKNAARLSETARILNSKI